MGDVIIIGLCGKAKSGKDTAANTLRDMLIGINTRSKHDVVACSIQHFADPIKQIGKICGFDEAQLVDQNLKENSKHPIFDITPRKFMQLVGTEMFRDMIDADFWTKLMEMKIEKLKSHLKKPNNDVKKYVVIIPDVRFENEAKMIHDNGGFVIKIERTSGIPAHGDEWRKHASETSIDSIECDSTFYNNTSSALGWCGEAISAFAKFFNNHGIEF